MQTLVETILKHHLAPRLLEEVQAAMQDEARRRREFREWIDDSVKAEFINGEIIMHSPVKKRHWQTCDLLSRLLSIYVSVKKMGIVGSEKVMISLSRNDYEPDICFFNTDKAVTFTDDQMLFPAPDFVVEVLSKRTAKTDRTIKKDDYAAHGIGEYWLIDPIKRTVEQYILVNPTDTTYFPARIYTYADDIASRVIVGFEIPVAAIFDATANVAALQQLLAA